MLEVQLLIAKFGPALTKKSLMSSAIFSMFSMSELSLLCNICLKILIFILTIINQLIENTPGSFGVLFFVFAANDCHILSLFLPSHNRCQPVFELLIFTLFCLALN